MPRIVYEPLDLDEDLDLDDEHDDHDDHDVHDAQWSLGRAAAAAATEDDEDDDEGGCDFSADLRMLQVVCGTGPLPPPPPPPAAAAATTGAVVRRAVDAMADHVQCARFGPLFTSHRVQRVDTREREDRGRERESERCEHLALSCTRARERES
jgi:hypothetical protein